MLRNLLFWIFIFGLCSPAAFSYEMQGTTVKREGCNVVITLQIAIESDSEDADVAMIKAALEPCWSIACDLPCADGSIGRCKAISRVIVKKWSELGAADQPKFHHVKIVPGSGTSAVYGLGVANSGKSSSGKWYRQEYSPKVYCHETMHLAGLPDRYRDCRPWRIEAGVDNCGDGKKCTARQVLDGSCPSCDSYENDVMGQDVTNAFDCTRNVLEVIKLVKDPDLLACPEKCCETHHSSAVPQIDSVHSGIIIDGGFGNYHFKDATDKENFPGFNFSIGYNATLPVMDQLAITGQAKLNYSSTSKTQTTTEANATDTSTTNSHTTYHLLILSLGANGEWHFSNNTSVFIGPEIGVILSDKYKSYGTTTNEILGVSSVTSFGSNSFEKNPSKKNVQFGFNLGAMQKIMVKDKKVVKPYLNIYLPVSNVVSNSAGYSSSKNKLYEFNIGVLIPLETIIK